MKIRLAGRWKLLGVCGILIALALVSSALPVQAVPQPGHHFYGRVFGCGPETTVSARINNVEYATTKVDAQGRYGYYPAFVVPADDTMTGTKEGGKNGDIVEFYVLGKLAGQAPFAVWGFTKLDLRLVGETYLTVTSTSGGSVTEPGEGKFTYNSGDKVDLLAVPEGGYKFVNWTGDVGKVADVIAADTTVIMEGDYAITANFALIEYGLTVTSTSGGSVTEPGGGKFTYNSGNKVDLLAVPESGYEFVNWTGDVSKVADVIAADTTVIVEGDYAITANFALTGDNKSAGNPPTSNDPPTFSGGSLIALMFIPNSENIEDVLASIDLSDSGLQTWYLYIPGDSSGSGYWVEMPIPSTK